MPLLRREKTGMETIVMMVPQDGLSVHFRRKHGSRESQVTLLLGSGVELSPETYKTAPSAGFSLYNARESGFPPRSLIEDAIVQILEENGGQVSIANSATKWNIYDEVAARLSVPMEVRRRLTSTGESAWRPEVGFARKNLEQRRRIVPTDESGRGVWKLAQL
jgi:hypothetical protein